MTILFLPHQRDRGPDSIEHHSSEHHAGSFFALCTQRPEPSTAVMQVTGEIDMLTAPRLAAEIRAQLRSRVVALVLDLREVTFLSVSGLRVLLATAEATERSDVSLSLVCRSAAVRRPLAALGLEDLFQISTALCQIHTGSFAGPPAVADHAASGGGRPPLG